MKTLFIFYGLFDNTQFGTVEAQLVAETETALRNRVDDWHPVDADIVRVDMSDDEKVIRIQRKNFFGDEWYEIGSYDFEAAFDDGFHPMPGEIARVQFGKKLRRISEMNWFEKILTRLRFNFA